MTDNEIRGIESLADNILRIAAEVRRAADENEKLRKLLWVVHGCDEPRRDDDLDFSCAICGVDFLIPSVEDLERRLSAAVEARQAEARR